MKNSTSWWFSFSFLLYDDTMQKQIARSLLVLLQTELLLCIAKSFLKYWAAKDHLPVSDDLDRSIAEIKHHYYMGKKTACLILVGLTGRNFGIAVDRHLKDAFKSMGWVLESCNDEEQISLMIEAWLDQALWGECNNVVAGLRQLWIQHKDLMLQLAAS